MEGFQQVFKELTYEVSRKIEQLEKENFQQKGRMHDDKCAYDLFC